MRRVSKNGVRGLSIHGHVDSTISAYQNGSNFNSSFRIFDSITNFAPPHNDLPPVSPPTISTVTSPPPDDHNYLTRRRRSRHLDIERILIGNRALHHAPLSLSHWPWRKAIQEKGFRYASNPIYRTSRNTVERIELPQEQDGSGRDGGRRVPGMAVGCAEAKEKGGGRRSGCGSILCVSSHFTFSSIELMEDYSQIEV